MSKQIHKWDLRSNNERRKWRNTVLKNNDASADARSRAGLAALAESAIFAAVAAALCPAHRTTVAPEDTQSHQLHNSKIPNFDPSRNW